MPIRLLREGILTSDRIELLDWPAEVFYRRLMSKVDDYGLFDARPSILRSSLYPLRVDRVREADIARWIAACEMAGVIALYVHGGKPFGQMLDTEWQTRSEPKQPLPPWGKSKYQRAAVNTCEQLKTTAHLDGDVVEDVKPPHPPAGGADGFSRFWQAWPGHKRKVGEKQCAAKWATQGCEPIADRIIAHVEAMKASDDWRKSAGGFIPAPLVYLNQNRWEAPAPTAPSNTVAPVETAAQYVARMAAERRASEQERAATPEQRAAVTDLLRTARQHVTAKGIAA